MKKAALIIILLFLSACSAPEEGIRHDGKLADVTEGKTLYGVTTEGKARGIARAYWEDDFYKLTATFEGLPDPEGTDFYEGWIVKKGILSNSVKSTGKAEKVSGGYMNLYTNKEDLLDHDLYVLTIEPDDGNPAPAAHILEGYMNTERKITG